MAASLKLSLGLLLLCTLSVVHCIDVKISGLSATGLKEDATSPPDGYVKVWCGSKSGGQTEILDNDANPSWHNELNFFSVSPNTVLKLEVWDKDVFFNDHLGTCTNTIRPGTNSITCRLSKGGTLNYSYRYD